MGLARQCSYPRKARLYISSSQTFFGLLRNPSKFISEGCSNTMPHRCCESFNHKTWNKGMSSSLLSLNTRRPFSFNFFFFFGKSSIFLVPYFIYSIFLVKKNLRIITSYMKKENEHEQNKDYKWRTRESSRNKKIFLKSSFVTHFSKVSYAPSQSNLENLLKSQAPEFRKRKIAR